MSEQQPEPVSGASARHGCANRKARRERGMTRTQQQADYDGEQVCVCGHKLAQHPQDGACRRRPNCKTFAKSAADLRREESK